MLLDGYGLVYRGYFALPPLTTSRGDLVNGAFGFASIVLRGLQDLHPDYLAVSFDLPGPTFRHDAYAEYKATRIRMPDDLRDQFPKVREIVKALRIPVYEMQGYEADDVIGTITKQLDARDDLVTTIVTVDLDMLQLVTPRVRLMTTRSGVENTVMYDVDKIDERFGLRPDQMVDYKALKGDPSDNIPGVPGVGEKTAAKLIRDFGNLDSLLDRLDEVTPAKLADKLREHVDQVRMGRELSRIVRDLPIQIDLEAARLGDYDRDTVVRLFREYEFRTLIERLPPMAGESAEQRTESLRSVVESGYVPAARVAGRPEGWGAGRTSARPETGELQLRLDFNSVARGPTSEADPGSDHRDGVEHTTRAGIVADDLPSALAAAIVDPTRIEVHGPDRIADLADWIAAQTVVGASLVADDPRPRRGTPLALAIAGTDGRVVAAEGAGVALDLDALAGLAVEFGEVIDRLEQEIYVDVGHEFNLGSPKQLEQILFFELNLPKGKRTKTGFSTDASVLEDLRPAHPMIDKLLEWRIYTKLRSTYVDALPTLMAADSRLHTTFHQAVAATGRLSSSDPNLQNIPIRTPLGRRIRRAFVAGEPDLTLLAADYSQVELRILAHVSGDEHLKDAFARKADIHRETAARVLHKAPEDITPGERSMAKMVNFGLAYGMSDFGLASRANIPRREAQEFINSYFAAYSGISYYMMAIKEQAKAQGFVETLLGRKRQIPELRASNPALRGAGERMAINMPIQGTAADIQKIAMIRVADRLAAEQSSARLLLTVHDELLFEVPREEVEALAAI